MAKRSPAANLGRTARKRHAVFRPRKPAIEPEAETVLPAPEPSPEHVIAILQAQVVTTRNAFFRLAQVRAADRVRSGELNWDQGAEYINAEIAGLDQQLAAAVKG